MSRPRRPSASPSAVRHIFAERLTQLRTAHGVRTGQRLSQTRFAALLGITGDAYGFYERGEREPSLNTLARLREVTGVSLDELIGS